MTCKNLNFMAFFRQGRNQIINPKSLRPKHRSNDEYFHYFQTAITTLTLRPQLTYLIDLRIQ